MTDLVDGGGDAAGGCEVNGLSATLTVVRPDPDPRVAALALPEDHPARLVGPQAEANWGVGRPMVHRRLDVLLHRGFDTGVDHIGQNAAGPQSGRALDVA